MNQYTPILKFAHSLSKKFVQMVGDVIYIKTNDNSKMAEALTAAYKAGKEWFVTMTELGNGAVEYKFSK